MSENTIDTLADRVTKLEKEMELHKKTADGAFAIAKKIADKLLHQFGIHLTILLALIGTSALGADKVWDPINHDTFSGAECEVWCAGSGTATIQVDRVECSVAVVSGEVTFSGNQSVGGNLTVTGTNTLGKGLVITTGGATVTAGNIAAVNSTLGVSNTTVHGTVNTDGKITVAADGVEITAGGLTVTAGNIAAVNSTLGISNTTVHGTVNTDGKITIAADGLEITAGGQTITAGNIAAINSTLGVSNTTVHGTVDTDGKVTIASGGLDITAGNMAAVNSTLGISNTTVHGTVNTDGKVTIASGGMEITAGNVDALASAFGVSNLTDHGSTTIDGNLSVAGTVTGTIVSSNVTGHVTCSNLNLVAGGNLVVGAGGTVSVPAGSIAGASLDTATKAKVVSYFAATCVTNANGGTNVWTVQAKGLAGDNVSDYCFARVWSAESIGGVVHAVAGDITVSGGTEIQQIVDKGDHYFLTAANGTMTVTQTETPGATNYLHIVSGGGTVDSYLSAFNIP